MIANHQQRKEHEEIAWTNSSNLIIFAFSTVFYARIFCSITGAPSVLIHAHFIAIPLIVYIILTTVPIKDNQQLKLVISFLIGLFIFLIGILISAFINKAGLINAIINFMMLGEPIIFLVAIASIPMSWRSFIKVRTWLIWSFAINFLLAAVQKPLIDSGYLYAQGFNGTDGCGGVFFVSGAGNYVSASVSMVFATYFLTREKNFPLWIRLTAMFAALWQLLFSDSKQLVFAYFIAWLLLIICNSQNIKNTLKLLIGMICVVLIFLWCVQNVEEFVAFTAWVRPELYEADGEAWYAKFYSVRFILDRYQSPLNWLFGLGPGHTVSRLGAWFLQDYWSLLAPLGATINNIGLESREFVNSFWLTYSSSLFSPLFSWAGIWGDLGFVGLGIYLYLGYLVWRYFALDNSLKITVLCIVVLGFIFTQMEEPGYMLFVSLLLGLAYQKQRLEKNIRIRGLYDFSAPGEWSNNAPIGKLKMPRFGHSK
ncbi:MAG: hypothetical protein ACFB02_20450 [Mastigocoleus sp.]